MLGEMSAYFQIAKFWFSVVVRGIWYLWVGVNYKQLVPCKSNFEWMLKTSNKYNNNSLSTKFNIICMYTKYNNIIRYNIIAF